jgi:hypothetical protein
MNAPPEEEASKETASGILEADWTRNRTDYNKWKYRPTKERKSPSRKLAGCISSRRFLRHSNIRGGIIDAEEAFRECSIS